MATPDVKRVAISVIGQFRAAAIRGRGPEEAAGDWDVVVFDVVEDEGGGGFGDECAGVLGFDWFGDAGDEVRILHTFEHAAKVLDH